MHRTILGAALLALAGSAHSMHIDPDGMGQVLIAPFYTVNAGNQTQLSIANRGDDGKALKVRFREGMNGREVFAFNLYLAPHDLWTGVVFSRSDDGAATLMTRDDSCTVPLLKTSTTLPQLPDGRPVAPFGNADYTGARNDAGPDDLLRTREGYFEVIEMGRVINGARNSLDHISVPADGSGGVAPADCPRIAAAWTFGGYWQQNPGTDIAPPGGDVTATVTLVDALAGTMYAYQAQAIDGFSAVAQHTAPDAGMPDLSAALTHPGQDFVEASVPLDRQVIVARYPLERAIDAVSALMMAESLSNEFLSEAATGSSSSWVISLPTRRFYTDDALVAAAIAPFTRRFSEVASEPALGAQANALFPMPNGDFATTQARGEMVRVQVWDREAEATFDCFASENPLQCWCPICGTPPPLPKIRPASLYWAVNLVALQREAQACDAPLVDASSRLCQLINAGQEGQGRARIDFHDEDGTERTPRHLLRASNAGNRFAGLPVLGFWALSFTNGNLQPGVLSNYAALRTHSVRRQHLIASP